MIDLLHTIVGILLLSLIFASPFVGLYAVFVFLVPHVPQRVYRLVPADLERVERAELKTIAGNVFLIFLSVSLVVSGLEVGLATDWGGGSSVNQSTETLRCGEPGEPQFDEDYGWKYPANQTYLRRWNSEQDWEVIKTNEDGFRDVYNSGSGNVIVLGDSFTAASLVGNNETFAHLLDRWHPSTAFHNYGVPGYATDSELLLYRKAAEEVNHGTVLLAFYMGNDMKGNLINEKRRPQFAVSNGTLTLVKPPENPYGAERSDGADAPQNEDNVETPAATGFLGGPVQGFQNYLSEHTATYPFLSERIRSLLFASGVTETTVVPRSELETRVQLTSALLREVGSEAAEDEADLVILAVPPKRLFSDPSQGYVNYINDQRSMIREVAAENDNVYAILLRKRIRSAMESGRPVYGRYNHHFDDYGHRLTAVTVTRRLAARDVVTSSQPAYNATYHVSVPDCLARLRP